MNKEKKRSLPTRIFIVVLVVAIAAPSAFAVIGLDLWLNDIRADFEAYKKDVDFKTANHLDGTVKDLKTMSLVLASDPMVRATLAGEAGALRGEGLAEKLSKAAQDTGIAILTTDGEVILNSAGTVLPKEVRAITRRPDFGPALSFGYWGNNAFTIGAISGVVYKGATIGYAVAAAPIGNNELQALAGQTGSDVLIAGRDTQTGSSVGVDAAGLYRQHVSKLSEGGTVEIPFDNASYVVREVRPDIDLVFGGADFFTIIDTKERLSDEARVVYMIALVFLVVMVGIMLAAIIALLLLNKQVFKPLRELSAKAREIASKGDAVFEVDGALKNEEIGEVQSALFELVAQLAQANNKWASTSQELKAVLDASSLAGRYTDMWQLANSITEKAQKLSKARFVHTIIINDKTQEMDIKVSSSQDEGQAMSLNELMASGVIDRIISSKRPVVFSDHAGEGVQRGSAKSQADNAMCVPMLYRDKVEGVLIVGAAEGGRVYGAHDLRLMVALANGSAVAVENARAYELLQDAQSNLVRVLTAAIDAKDQFTHGHSKQVAVLAVAIAKARGWTGQRLKNLEIAAYLHDIGKLSIPNDILTKPGKLTPEEMTIVMRHPGVGAAILAQVSLSWDVGSAIRHHHERFDGTGYPAGLAKKEIPEAARIIALANAFESMTTQRPYRKAKSFEQAIAEISKDSGAAFDPDIVSTFMQAVRAGMVALGGSQLTTKEIEDYKGLASREVYTTLAQGLLRQYSEASGHVDAEVLARELNRHFVVMGMDIMVDGKNLDFHTGETPGLDDQAGSYLESLKYQIELMEKEVGAQAVSRFCRLLFDAADSMLAEAIREYGFDQICSIEVDYAKPIG